MKGACPRGHLLSGREQGQQETNSSPAGAEGHKGWDHPPPCINTGWDAEGGWERRLEVFSNSFGNCWDQAPALLLVRVLVPAGKFGEDKLLSEMIYYLGGELGM